MKLYLIGLIGYYAGIYGVDPLVAMSVAKVESGLNNAMVGTKGEIGLFQIMPSTYPNVSKKALSNPETNIKLGIKYLSWVKNHCKHKDEYTWVICFNYGIKNCEHVKYPKLFPYYKKVMETMKEFKKGDKVVVQNLYNSCDGKGIYIGLAKDQHQWKNQHQVLAEGMVMHFELARLRKEENDET